MKKLLILMVIALAAIALILGCGKKADENAGKTPPDVKKAEIIDSTRMDSAAADLEVIDSTATEAVDNKTTNH
ncbi:MAG: hypothetical protein DRP47_12720 [Candidatus Zixiibacteriota bacterium]|nr:MAG: hypothetical protein DRP47_12720 [candidate division Zixibacteria bacterium]